MKNQQKNSNKNFKDDSTKKVKDVSDEFLEKKFKVKDRSDEFSEKKFKSSKNLDLKKDSEKISNEDSDEDKDKLENDRLKQKIAELQKSLDESKDVNLRLKAEFDNFKKRTKKEKLSTYTNAKSDCVTPLLEVLDNLERALTLVEKKDKFSQGIDLVVNKFYDVLKSIGVSEIKSLGELFDPAFHEAIKVVEDEKYEKNVICEVLQKGFVLGDVVVRHALVVVANP